MNIRTMDISDYNGVYALWLSCKNMGFNDVDDSHDGIKLVNTCLSALKDEGISKVALLVFRYNEAGNDFWEKQGFTLREDIFYRNKALCELVRIDT